MAQRNLVDIEEESVSQRHHVALENEMSHASTVGMRPAVRSSPIAIDQNRTSRNNDVGSDDDSLPGTRVDKIAYSMPARLLQAPRLGSKPHKEDQLMEMSNMLPPAMSLSGEAEGSITNNNNITVPYGSLRESHMNGRFMDGPSSYREKSTGAIHSYNKIRFGENQVAGSLPVSISIGERIMQGRQGRGSKPADDQQGSLAAMMEGTNLSDQVNIPPDNPRTRQVAFSEAEPVSQSSPDMLSTSLTAFEILRRATTDEVRIPSQTKATGRFGSLQELPRTEMGLNAILNRSTSDPTPAFGSRASPPFSPLEMQEPPTALPAATYYGNGLLTREGILGPDPAVYAAAAYSTEPAKSRSGSQDYDPDTEGAFDLDME